MSVEMAYTGQIITVAFDYVIADAWLAPNGREIPRSSYPMLSNFAGQRLKSTERSLILPKLDGPDDVPKGFRHLLCHDGSYPIVSTDGDESGTNSIKALLGQVIYMAIDIVPEGWCVADGRTLSAIRFDTLYSVIGNRFGGNEAEFNIPNLINAPSTPKGTQPLFCVAGQYPPRDDRPEGDYYFCQIIHLAFDTPVEAMQPCDGSDLEIVDTSGLVVQHLLGNRFGSSTKRSVRLPKIGDAKGMIDGLTPRIALYGDFPAPSQD